MKTKRISKASKRRILFFGIPSLFIVFYFVFSTANSVYSIIKLKGETKRLEQQLYLLKNDEEDLKTEIKKLKDPDYIARYAREKYFYSKDGEYVIRIDEKEPEELENESNTNYKFIFITSGLVGSIILIIIRKKLI